MATAGPDTATAPYTKRAPSMLMIVIRTLGALFLGKQKVKLRPPSPPWGCKMANVGMVRLFAITGIISKIVESDLYDAGSCH